MSNVTISKFSDGTNTGYIASQAYFECSTAAGTAAKAATSPDSITFSDTSLVRGITIQVKFTNINSASNPTLKVGTSTAKSIKGSTNWPGGSVVSFTYDGTNWILNDEMNFGGYLTFSSPESFTLKVNTSSKHWDGILEYSTDTSTWNTWSGTTTLSSNNENKLYLRGIGNTKITGDFHTYGWTLTGSNISCLGNIENLLDYQIVAKGGHPTMANYCYYYLFSDCTSLITAPELPAIVLTDYCYASMFSDCTSLTTAPALPATTLAAYCYYYMFYNCTSLISTPELPAITLAVYCYNNMFRKCTSLIAVPTKLPAIVLADYCYASMFRECASLTTTPDLPATILAYECYDSMFEECTSLTSIPSLPATTLTTFCYNYMFGYCSSIKLSSTQTGEYQIPYRIPSSGTGTAGTNGLTNMFSSTGGTFKGTPSINKTYYLSTSNSTIYPNICIEYTPNKVTTIDSNSTDLQYPSAKAVYDLFTSITDADNQSY